MLQRNMEHIFADWNDSSTTSNLYKRIMTNRPLLVSDNERQIIVIIFSVFLNTVISLLGIVANAINMLIFYSHGLSTTINISFFAIAFSDLCSLLFQEVFSLSVNPLCQALDWPIVYLELGHMTGGIPREIFARITCLITVYITAERCLCIAFPLQVKQMITPRRTAVIITFIYVLTFAYVFPFYVTNYIDWRYDLVRNRSLLMILVKDGHDVTEAVMYFIHSGTGFVSFLAVVIFTLILIRKLSQKSAWRKAVSAHQDKSLSRKDRSTTRMVTLIASVLIMCFSPAVLLSVITVIEPEFYFGGHHFNIFYMLWSVALVLETINSSVNIFLYYKMSSKFRKSFQQLFHTCISSDRHS